MKKLFATIIGLTISLGSIHYMPDNAMSDEMSDMSHCSLCSMEDQDETPCKSPLENSESGTLIPIPSADDCDCDLETDENNHHAGIIQSQSQQLKEKTSSVTWSQLHPESFDTNGAFLFSKHTNAPSANYLKSLITIRQLK